MSIAIFWQSALTQTPFKTELIFATIWASSVPTLHLFVQNDVSARRQHGAQKAKE